ncbi:MAG: hypothetical protein ACREGR_04955 [Minisyncoccia bacterium]
MAKGPTSKIIRGLDWTWFRAIPVGGKFRFSLDVEGYGTKTGVCEKVSPRKYRYEDGMECRVGSIDAIVVKVDEQGQVKRSGLGPVVYVGD